MSTFNESLWADSAFAQDYREAADHYLPERAYLMHVLRSFCRRFVLLPNRKDRPTRVCDLGCGDGILTAQLLDLGHPLEATLVDGSGDMLAAARNRLGARPDVRCVQSGFDELIRDASGLESFDLVLSGFAIHHLHRQERQGIFRVAYDHLEPGGHFVNVEIVLAESRAHTEWHYELWREWIDAHGRRSGVGDRYHTIPDQALANPDNKFSPLQDQLDDLRSAGFVDVECHYRNGIFGIYSGTRPAA